MLQYLYVGYLIIFLTSALLTRSAIHLIINAWISAKTRQKRRGDMSIVEGYIGIKRNGDKTQMQSTHYNALGFMGIVMT